VRHCRSQPFTNSSLLPRALGLAFVLAALSGTFLAAQTQTAGLPTLTTTRATHQLSIPEAKRAYPVLLRAVVTYYQPFIDTQHPALFVSDYTGSVFATLAMKSARR